ncbi:MAG: DUF354 domain-containing protein [Ardenticatenaceae bacterium]|nr:DUF354 domain-containing protein [Ardenticatenaceae bacterium]
MKIWLDLANSPQVMFFRPILAALQAAGHEVKITTRDYAQTVQLADQLGMKHTLIGGHGGRAMKNLVMQNVSRARALMRFARPFRFDLALSHNAYSQIMAAKLLGIPAVTIMDYEHQPLNHLAFRLAKRVIVPEPFPRDLLRKFGAGRKAVAYPGVKEQIYLADFVPDADFRQKEGLPADCPLVVIRPPAPWTAYHRFENDIFDEVLQAVTADPHRYCLFLPRLASQAESVYRFPTVHVADKVYDGPNLLYHADLVISGGGTMNREAAVLGTPTYTVFKGKLGAVDDYLIKRGRMIHLRDQQDVQTLLQPQPRQSALLDQAMVADLTQMILSKP